MILLPLVAQKYKINCPRGGMVDTLVLGTSF